MHQYFSVATVTRDIRYSDTDDPISLLVSRAGIDIVNDVINRGFWPSSREWKEDTGQGEARLYEIAGRDLEEWAKPGDDYYVRIGIGGQDLWRPRDILVFTRDPSHVHETRGNALVSRPLPLAIETDLPVEIPTKLSADREEGVTSIPIRRVALGDDDTLIARLLCIIETAAGDFFDTPGTDNPVSVHVRKDGWLVVGHTFPDTSQTDFESGQCNMYFAPVLSQFNRRGLDDTSIELVIGGDNAWVVTRVIMFGVDTDSGRPETLVPLVDAWYGPVEGWISFAPPEGWGQGLKLSTDSSEGRASAYLPLAP